MDQDYLVIGNHIDQAMKDKTVQGQYVDFSKLIPKDSILVEEDDRMELVIKSGKTFWTHVSESVSINNFPRWEQAFRVFSNIYAEHHPHKSSELIQYNHIIHSISLTYVWENVYAYDKDFKLHIARHPEHNWAVILQQAWSMRLRDRIVLTDGGGASSSPYSQSYNKGDSSNNGIKSHDYCKRFNRGKYNLGAGCCYEHRCSYCNKFGHGVFVCRKLIYDREQKSRKGGKDGHSSNAA